MSAVYCIKKILYFSDLANELHAISNYFRLFLWLLVIHLLLLIQGHEVFLGLLYGPLIWCIIYKMVGREISKAILFVQILPFFILTCIFYGYPSIFLSNFVAGVTVLSLASYSTFLLILKSKIKSLEYHKVMVFSISFLVLLMVTVLMQFIEAYSYVLLLVSPDVSLAIFLISSISISSINLIRDQIPGLRQADIDELEFELPIQEENLLLIHKIERYFMTSKHYLNPCFTFDKFAKEIDIPKAILSTAINRGMNKSFYQLLAEHRVAHAKTLLIEQNHLFKIESVIYECGFNSKSSFHKYFKQFVGTTPSDFRHNYLRKQIQPPHKFEVKQS